MQHFKADKDLTKRDVMRCELPDALLPYHTLRTFCREVSQEQLGIKFAECTMCLAFMEAMAYVGSPADYDDLYVQFCASAPVAVRRYFDRNWHEIREEWVACFKLGHGNYMTNTNNRLESLNQKIKNSSEMVFDHTSVLPKSHDLLGVNAGGAEDVLP